jgi:hypothetical protein
MKYLKTDLKILIAIFFGLSLMAWAGEPVTPVAVLSDSVVAHREVP